MTINYKTDRCLNPFREKGKKGHYGKPLRTIPTRMLNIFPCLPKNGKCVEDVEKNLIPKKPFLNIQIRTLIMMPESNKLKNIIILILTGT